MRGAVDDGGVELDDAEHVRLAAASDTGVRGVRLDDARARLDGVESAAAALEYPHARRERRRAIATAHDERRALHRRPGASDDASGIANESRARAISGSPVSTALERARRRESDVTSGVAAQVVARSEATRRGAVSERIEVRATAKDATVGPGVRPLADIANEIDDALGRGTARVPADRRRQTDVALANVRALRILRIAPRPSSSRRAAGRLLPLAFVRQPIDAAGAHAEPAAVRDRIRPRHTFDRMRGPLGLAAPTGRSHV